MNRLNIASVGFVNARPLIEGLSEDPEVKLSMHVPSKLAGLIDAGDVDVALLPVVDYPKIPGLRVIPSGGIGCEGPTLTVRVFSHDPFEKVRVVATDPDSHTSVALARIIFHNVYKTDPEFIDLAKIKGGEAQLLIGDKVVCDEPIGFEHQLDLGEAWHRWTGMPFVFAIWCARSGVMLGDLPRKLVGARLRGQGKLREIVQKYAVPRGWPAGLALQYLGSYLKYDIGARQLGAIRLFHEKCAELGIIEAPPRPLELVTIVQHAMTHGHLWSDD